MRGHVPITENYGSIGTLILGSHRRLEHDPGKLATAAELLADDGVSVSFVDEETVSSAM